MSEAKAAKAKASSKTSTQDLGQQARDLFDNWKAEMKEKDCPNWNDFFWGGKLSPKAIAREIGINENAFKPRNNRELREKLDELQDELSGSGIYHKRKPRLKVEETEEKQPSETEKDVTDSAKVRALKQANRHLENENARLTAEVAKLSEFKDVLKEMGLWK